MLEEIKFDDGASGGKTDIPVFTRRHALCLATFVGGFILYIYGSSQWRWESIHLAAMMLAMAITCGLIAGFSPNTISKHFINGCKNMVYGAMVVGFATAITIVLEHGKVIHTIIYYLTKPLMSFGTVMAAEGMFYACLIFNFFVPSGSAMAAIVMPLMAPMADIIGFSRQISVLAYQYGDGLSNIIIPTSGVLMSVLGIAGIPFTKWIKWVMPLFIAWVAVGTAAVALAVIIGLQ